MQRAQGRSTLEGDDELATHEVERSKHTTLTPDIEDQVTIITASFNRVEVSNRHASGWIYFTVNGHQAAFEADNTIVVPPSSAVSVTDLSVSEPTVVRLISTVAAPYSVTGFSESS